MRAFTLSLLLVISCGGSALPPQTTVNDARNEDPWLVGVSCPPVLPVLALEDLVEGIGKPVEAGDTVRVHYVAALPGGGAPIHESRASGAPIEVIVGSGKTFCGFEKALVGMRAGGKRRVLIPSVLAFGDKGHSPDVPPGADLTLTLEVFWPAESAASHGGGQVNPSRGGAGGGRRR